MDHLAVPGEGEDISLASISPDLSDDSGLNNRAEEEISVSDIETIDSAADFKLEICYFIFTHLKKVIGWTSPFLKITEIIVVSSVYVSIITATFLLTFHLTYEPVLAIFYACDGIYMIHLLFSGFVALSPSTAWSTPSQLNFRQQCRFYCMIDLVTVIPFELILSHQSNNLSGMQVNKLNVFTVISGTKSSPPISISINYIALGRLNRLLRVYRLVRFFNNKKNDVILGTRFSDILSATCALTLLIHISACIWYWLGCKPFTKDMRNLNICWSIKDHTFVNANDSTTVYSNFEYHPENDAHQHSWTLDVFTVGQSDDHHFMFLYIISAYWATVTALGVGYGDFRGLNLIEMRFSILVMLLGSAITNGLVVGSLTSLLTNVNSQRASFAHRLVIITRYLQENKYSNNLSETIQGFYEYMWFKKKGHSTNNIYDALPPSLQSEICLSVNHCALSRSPMFKDLDEGFLRSIALKIQSHFFLPGQIVVNKGTVSRCMYYIVRGELEVLSDRDNCTPVAVLRPGKLFGEVNLVLNFARTATIRAASHCDLLILNQHDVTPVLLHYPDARLAMWEYVRSIFEMDFNEPEDSTKQASSAKIVDAYKGSLVTNSVRFMPTLSPMVESEESLRLNKDESSANKNEAVEKGEKADEAPQSEKAIDSRFPAISAEDRSKYDGDMVPKTSSIPVFKDSSKLVGPPSNLSTSLSSQKQDRGSFSGVQRLSRPSVHVAGSSRKVATSEIVMQKGDEPIPAFEKPNELHHAASASTHRNMNFDWKDAKPDSLRKNVRRPTIINRPKGMSEVKLSQDCVALKSDASLHGISWLKQLVHHIKEPHIQEDSAFDNTWKTCVCTVVVVQWFLYLYHASFQAGYSSATLMLTYFLDAVHLADLIISMMTVVITPRQTYETYRQIFFYRTGTLAFYLDIIAALPLDLICAPFTVSMEVERRSQLITICKLNKLTKAWVIYHRFRFFEDQLYIPLKALRPIETIVYILMGIHLNACLWYMDANLGHILVDKPKSDEWMNYFFKMKDHKKTLNALDVSRNNSAYILSLYWAAATMSTTGYGDIVAMSIVEYCISILTMVMGLVLFSYSLASYASLLTNLDRPKVQFQSIVFAMEKFMAENRLDKVLRNRVLRYMDVQWEAYDGLIMPGRPSLMHDLPEALQQDLAADGIVQLLDSVPLFHGTDATFRQELSSRCSRYLFPPNELVLYSGDLGRDMYIIIRGYCESFLGKRQKSLGLMGPGEYFGEAGMLYGLPRPAHVVTRTHCSLLAIPHGEFQRIMKKFPTVNMEIRDLQDNAAILRTVKLNHARVWRLSKDLPPSSDSLFPLEEPQSFTTFPEKDTSEEYRRPFAELGRLGSPLACLLMPRTVRPDGRFAVQLECFRIAIIMLVLIVTPVHITFAWNSFSLYALGILFDIVAMIYVYLRLHWAYYDETSTLITHPLTTARNYLASAFLLDLVGCFPFDLIAMLFFQGNIYGNLHSIVLFRSNRMIQWYEIAWAFYHWERRMLFRSGIFKAIKYFSYFGIYVHIVACLWAYVACPALFSGDRDIVKGIEGRIREYSEYNETKFTEKHENCRTYSWYSTSHFAEKTGGSLEMYMVSVMYTLEMIASVGYGDMTPQSRVEFILAIILMVHGVIFFGFVIASVTASFVNADITRANFNERVKELAEQMRYELVPDSLQKKVLKHVEYAFFRSQGMEAHALFTNLPPSIRGDIAVVLFEDLISSVPIFKTIDRSFHRMLAMCLKEVFFLEGETVIFAGDMGEEMFFIHRGICDVIDDDGKTIASLGPGRFFGEVSVMFSIPRTATIKARQNADLFVLTKNDLHDVLENYPDINREIERIAIKGLKDAGQRKMSREEHQAMPRKSESGGRSGSMTGGNLMEARHGRKHKTHHRRSLAIQLADALIPHSLSKDQHGLQVNNQTLEDEYKALLQSEEHEQQQKEHLVERRRSSQATHIKGLMRKIFSSHSTATGSNDEGKVNDNIKTDVSTKVDDTAKTEDKPEADKKPKVDSKLKLDGKSDADEKIEVDSKPKVDDTDQVSEKQKLERMPKVDGKQEVENKPKVDGKPKMENEVKVDGKLKVYSESKEDEMDRNATAGTSGPMETTNKVAKMSQEEIDASELLSTRNVSGRSSDLPGPLKGKSGTMNGPQLPPIGLKHMSKSDKTSEDNIKKKSVISREVSNNQMPSVTIRSSDDITPAVKQNSSTEGSTENRVKEPEEYDTNRTQEETGAPADESGVQSLESGSQPGQRSGTSHQVYVSRHTGANGSSADIAPVTAPGIANSAHCSADPSSISNASEVSITSAGSARSEFRPPLWLDACFQRINRLAYQTILSDFIIIPESRLLLLFNLSLAILGIISTMIIFYQLAFADFNETLNKSLLGISLAYTINIYIRMHTAYHDAYGDLVCNQNTVRRKYMHRPTGFLIDVLSALPVGLLGFIHHDSPELSEAIHKIRFVQLMRFYTVFNFFRCWESVLNAPVLLLRSLRDVGFLLMLLHIWACFWYMAACPAGDCIPNSWIFIRKLVQNSTKREQYMNSLYFTTATMTSTGYGDIHPATMREVVVCIGAILVGKFAIGLIIGDLASTLSNLEVVRVDMEAMLAVIVNQMKDQAVPKHLQERVKHHVEYDWLRNRGHNLKDLLQHVPYCLRVEVFESIYGNQLRSISIFESAPDYVIRRLSALCEQQVFLPGDFITKRGDIGGRVYIVRRGSVLVYRTSRDLPEYFLYSGSIYGDVQMVYPTIPYEHHLVADYPSDVLVINQADIQLLLADNPHFFFRVRRYIQKKYPDIVHDKRPSMAVRV